jgi:fructose-1-phosphate kinase PfkB-like protein
MQLFLLFQYLLAGMSSKSTTVIFGLNGALQKRFVLSPDATLVPGNVHRAAEIQTGIGGKGQDVAISLSCLDFPNVQLAHFVGTGPEGDTVLALLKNRVDDATSLSLRTASAMRTCTTIVASDESTELVEPSGVVTEEERDAFLAKCKEVSPPAAICIMGSMPPGLPVDMYATMYDTMVASSSDSPPLCVIDSVVGLDHTLTAIARAKGPCILKINASELCALAGVAKSSSEAGGILLEELVTAVDAFVEKFDAVLDGLAITDGRHAAHLVSFTADKQRDIYQIKVPSLDPKAVLYPIGAGDSVAAGTLGAWKSLVEARADEKKKSLSDAIHAALDSRISDTATLSEQTKRIEAAFAFGLSCGSASCLEEENSVLDVKKVLKLFQEIPPPELVSRLAPTP